MNVMHVLETTKDARHDSPTWSTIVLETRKDTASAVLCLAGTGLLQRICPRRCWQYAVEAK